MRAALYYLRNGMDKKQFQKERALVKDALESERGEAELRTYLTPFVHKTADDYIARHPELEPHRDHIRAAGFAHLNTAIKNYPAHADAIEQGEKEPFLFTEYYTWFTRHGIREHLVDVVGHTPKYGEL